MLIGNYSVLNKTPGRWLGGNSTSHASGVGQNVVVNRSNWGTTGATRNIALPDAGEANELWSRPDGYGADSWIMPIVAGSISSHNLAAGTSSYSAAIVGGLNGVCSITGLGDLVGVGELVVSATASLSGDGDLAGLGVGTLAAVASFGGLASVASTLRADAYIVSSVSGDGDLSIVPYATGELAASILVTGGELLTAPAVADAVWSFLLEAGFSAERIMRIIAAATAGKSSGGPGSSVFRDVSDSTDMVSSTANTSGDRTAVTYGE